MFVCLCQRVSPPKKKDDDDDKVKVKDDGSRVWRDIAVMMVIETSLTFFRSSDFCALTFKFLCNCAAAAAAADWFEVVCCVLCAFCAIFFSFFSSIVCSSDWFCFRDVWWCVEPLSLLTNWLTDWLSRRTGDWKVSNAFDVMKAQKLKEDQILGACHRLHYNSSNLNRNKRNKKMATAPGKGMEPMMAPVNKLGKWGWMIVRCLVVVKN